MNAHLTDQQLIDYQFDLASEVNAARARAHLEKCDACRRRLHELARRFTALELVRDDVKASRTLLSATIQNARRAGRFRRIFLHQLPWLGAVAAAVIVGIALLAMPYPGGKTGPAPQLSFESTARMDTDESESIVAGADAGQGRPGLLRERQDAPKMTMAPSPMAGDAKAESPAGGVRAGLRSASTTSAIIADIDEQPPFAPASAIELVVLPRREDVQLTIYNAADLTLVRERRNLTLKRGWNWLQFMWANTLIDPTSLHLEPLEHKGQVEVQQLVFPPRLKDLGRWLIRSEIDGQAPFELTYFTSGLTWRAFYMGTLSQDEKKMRLEGYVRVDNRSGEDYENARTRLLVGRVHLLDQIAELAKRQYPYGSPLPAGESIPTTDSVMLNGDEDSYWFKANGLAGQAVASSKRKEIRKEGLSEYFLYTIEGTETIPNDWGKRLLSFEADEIPVVGLYKYDEERWGTQTIRFLSFANDSEHKLGETPLPDGTVRIYGRADEQGHLSYIGGMDVKYIPVGEEIELDLGPARLVEVEPVLMDYRTQNHTFDGRGEVNGWDEVRVWKIEIGNAGKLPIRIEVTRGFGTPYWTLKATDGGAAYRKHDATHARFELAVPARQTQVFEYEVTTYHGVRQEGLSGK
jgi:hypothetical protein